MQNNNVWQSLVPADIRKEAHFNDRVVNCFPKRPANLDDMLRQTAANFPDSEALVFYSGERITYRELDARVDAAATNLTALGLPLGERVAVYMANSIELVITYFGILRAGMIIVPIGILQQKPEVAYAINNCTAAILIFDGEASAKIPEAAAVPSLRYLFSVGENTLNAASFAQLLKPAPSPFPRLPIEEEDTALIMHTSGTTGKPKGATLCHLGVWHAAKHHALCLNIHSSCRTVLVIPGTHVSGVVAIIMSTLQLGGCMVIARGFDTRQLLQLLRDEKITDTMAVPTIYTRILMEPDFDSFNLGSHWRSALYGGAPMPEATIKKLRHHLPALKLHQGYGATETSAVSTLIPADQTAQRATSVGAAVHCLDVRIMDENGREMAAHDVGEIWIGGPSTVKGYWNDSAETARNFISGYWRSGDLGTLDEEGYLRILDRRNDVINRAGYKVYSVEVENVITFIDGVVETAIVPIPCPVLGARVQAFVFANIELSEKTIRDYCSERLAAYKVPDFIEFCTTPLPRNLNGKIMKAPLREMALALAAQRPALRAKQ
ncbi:MAG TPA: class I adenylate-forming enzyme family protein [Spongiibacteraceae bacterium]